MCHYALTYEMCQKMERLWQLCYGIDVIVNSGLCFRTLIRYVPSGPPPIYLSAFPMSACLAVSLGLEV